MNPDTQNPTPESAVPPSEPSTANLQPSTFGAYRGNGKVACLPKAVRDQICNWMLDGLFYPDIIQRLGEHGHDLKPAHLSEWKKRGYQNWILEQAWLAQTRARQEPAAALSTDFDATQINHAALQLGTLHIFEAFRDLFPPPSSSTPVDTSESLSARREEAPAPHLPSDGIGARSEAPSSLPGLSTLPSNGSPTPGDSISVTPHFSGVPGHEQATSTASAVSTSTQNSPPQNRRPRSVLDLKLGGDSAAFVRLINALARASRETMLVQKYRDACARARNALQELKDPKRNLTESETRAIVLKVDNILGLRSEDDQPEPDPGKPPTIH